MFFIVLKKTWAYSCMTTQVKRTGVKYSSILMFLLPNLIVTCLQKANYILIGKLAWATSERTGFDWKTLTTISEPYNFGSWQISEIIIFRNLDECGLSLKGNTTTCDSSLKAKLSGRQYRLSAGLILVKIYNVSSLPKLTW